VILSTLAALAGFGPLALYLCWLATLNRRPKPTVVPGGWDFAFVLAGLSGFLLVGGVLLMDATTRYLIRGNFTELLDGWHKFRAMWLMVAVGYIFTVLGLASLTLARRARWLSVYNIELADAERAMEASLHACGLPVQRVGYRWLDGAVEFAPHRGSSHVTIILRLSDSAIRQELERKLWIELAKAAAPQENAAAGWFTSLAVSHTILVVGFVGFASYILFFR
jgi:hypothetical protein